ncbi:hypothetical protein ES702_07302 [subsurface metagenome]
MVEEPRESETPTKKEYVVERWWHRLLKTIKYITTLIIVFGALLVVIPKAQYYTYSYSFEPDYAGSKGKEFNCNAYDYIDSIGCGDLNTGEEFMAKYVESKPTAKVYYEPKEIADLKFQVQRLIDAGVPEHEIGAFIRRNTKTQPLDPREDLTSVREKSSPIQKQSSPSQEELQALWEKSTPIQDRNNHPFSDFEIARFIIKNHQIKYKRRLNFNTIILGLGVILLIAITWYIVALVLYKIVLYIVHGHTRVRKLTPNS